MRLTLLCCVLSLSWFSLKAQPALVTIKPNPVDTVFQVDAVRLAAGEPYDLVAKATLINNTNDTLIIRWERNVVNVARGWDTKICDNNLCYVEIVTSNIDPTLMLNEPLILLPKGKSNLDVHFLPNGVVGTGKVELEVALARDPNRVLAVGQYNVEVVAVTLTNTQSLHKRTIQVYPNPSGDYFSLSSSENVDKITVYNMVGRAVRTFRVEDNTMYDISKLPDGVYLIGLHDKKGNIIKTIRVSKRSARP